MLSLPQHIARQVRFSEPRRHFAVSFGNLRCESQPLREAARREHAAKLAIFSPEKRSAACAAPFLRHASAGARRRSARDPGAARPRLVIDDAALHRRRYRATAGSLLQHPSAGMTDKGVTWATIASPCESRPVRYIVRP